MPELHDVEHFRRLVREYAAFKRLRRAIVLDPTLVRVMRADPFAKGLAGRTFGEPKRHGTWLLCPTDGPTLILHFGMTGSLLWSPERPQAHAHDRLVLEL